ncbi:uncharacterized protein VTP21DRAFT_1797 [Calcarisporiella thermophila]|uniref:uncharacterized protein n=1 Tax=Calcarisporiella thermophila TaxID=911321 RepID=UPI0037442E3B
MSKSNIPKPSTDYAQLENITLKGIQESENEVIKASDLWKDTPAVVFVVRRPGCQFCREQAVLIAKHRDLLVNGLGFRLFAVVHERLGAEEFNNNYWKGEIYWDENKGFYKALGGGSLRVASKANWLKPEMWKHVFRNRKSGVTGNFVGDGFIYGGIYLVKRGNAGVAFEYRERIWGDLFPLSHLLLTSEAILESEDKKLTIETQETLSKAIRLEEAAEKEEYQQEKTKEGGQKSASCSSNSCTL